MKTRHKIIIGDSRNMSDIQDKSVNLMITSPPYPMIKMWDEMFSKQSPELKKVLADENGEIAFEFLWVPGCFLLGLMLLWNMNTYLF